MAESVGTNCIFDGQYLRCTLYGTGPPLFATYDNFVLGKAGFSDANLSQKILAAGFRQVAIQSASNDWYLNPELDDLISALRNTAAGFEGSKALGFSMGGFGALLFASA